MRTTLHERAVFAAMPAIGWDALVTRQRAKSQSVAGSFFMGPSSWALLHGPLFMGGPFFMGPSRQAAQSGALHSAEDPRSCRSGTQNLATRRIYASSDLATKLCFNSTPPNGGNSFRGEESEDQSPNPLEKTIGPPQQITTSLETICVGLHEVSTLRMIVIRHSTFVRAQAVARAHIPPPGHSG